MPDTRYFWLLMNKLASIGIRPLAVIFEAYFVGAYEVRLLPIVIPASMLIMSMVSVPIHKEFYQSTKNDALGLYLGSLSALLLFSVVFTFLYFNLKLDKNAGAFVFLIICGNVICDKVADEVNRYLEFQKKYFGCVAAQLIKNFWLFTYCIILLWPGQDYGRWMVISIATQFIISLIMLMMVFKANYKNLMYLRRAHLKIIIVNAPYVVHGILPSWLLNTARLSVSIAFPEYGSIFLLATQMASVFPLVIDIAYISRRRKLIARRSKYYAKIIRPIITNIFMAINAMVLVSLLIFKLDWAGEVQLLVIFAIFLVLITSLSAICSEILFWSLTRGNYFYLGGGVFLIIGLLSIILGVGDDVEMASMFMKSIFLFNLYYLTLYLVVRMRSCK